MARLKTLNLANNKIHKIQEISENLPSLENLILINNKLEDISEFYKLRKCFKLKRLFVQGNLICQVLQSIVYYIMGRKH